MRNILIIGGSSGIGKELCNKLSKDNNVFATFNQKSDSSRDQVNFQYYNAEEQTELKGIPDTLHGLVYCPGSIYIKPFKRTSAQDIRDHFELNVLGAVDVIQQCQKHLVNGNGSIVLMSSVAARIGFNFHSLISICKGAIEGLSKSLSAEFAPNVRVNVVAPSLTDTPLASGLLNSEAKISANKERHPMKEIGEAKDIANSVAFLLSDEAKWITGQTITVDGGLSSIR